jgi:hypothetical protein
MNAWRDVVTVLSKTTVAQILYETIRRNMTNTGIAHSQIGVKRTELLFRI